MVFQEPFNLTKICSLHRPAIDGTQWCMTLELLRKHCDKNLDSGKVESVAWEGCERIPAEPIPAFYKLMRDTLGVKFFAYLLCGITEKVEIDGRVLGYVPTQYRSD